MEARDKVRKQAERDNSVRKVPTVEYLSSLGVFQLLSASQVSGTLIGEPVRMELGLSKDLE